MSNFSARRQDISIRAIGLVAIGTAIIAIGQLYGSVHAAPHHEATMIELVLAAIGFAGMCGGGALVALGHHIFDEVAITRPWGRAASFEPLAETKFNAEPTRSERRKPAAFNLPGWQTPSWSGR